jgi:two-component system, NtrC family, sensor kinase
MVELIPQDVSRVLLNMYNNAYYAVMEKRNRSGPAFEPIVTVSTLKTGRKVEIRIRDNGTGIPEKVISKIFQPFFTTKPTGQGTGLGLSLSYDIIKAHGGDLKVDTREGEWTEFIIELPC